MNKEAESAKSRSALPVAQKFETYFAEFSYRILSNLYDFKNRQIIKDTKSALINIRKDKQKLYEPGESTHFSSKFSFKDPPVRCAYMYAYNVLNSVMVYSEFLSLLQDKNVLLPVCKRDILKICCLGGGPGMEVVAICKFINDYVLESCTRSADSVLKVNVTVLDELSYWSREGSAVIKAVKENCDVLHMKKMNLKTNFVKIDLLKPLEENVKEEIKEADIVTIVKISELIQHKTKKLILNLQVLIDNVIESMRSDSILFILDKAGGNFFRSTTEVLKNKKGTSCFKTSLHKDYVLDFNSGKKMSDLLRSKKDTQSPPLITFKGKISSCIWIKDSCHMAEASSSLSPEHRAQVEKTGNSDLCSPKSDKNQNCAIPNKVSNSDSVGDKPLVTDEKITAKSKNVGKKKTKGKM